MTADELYVGIMSGTSLDGVDVAVARFGEGSCTLLASAYAEYDPILRAELLELQEPCTDELHRAEIAAIQVARRYAEAVNQLLQAHTIDHSTICAIGAHGQTIRHRPELGYTKQLLNPALLAELTTLPVVADFRSRDIAAGGQGAPLVPAFHAALFGSAEADRIVCNIGGIANLTCLRARGTVTGFDTGPGNVLLDAWIARTRNERFDRDGAWGASGTVIDELLEALLTEPYYALPPPKSTGRELFNAHLFEHFELGRHDAADVQATFAMLTARTIADAVQKWGGAANELYVCGGGAHNHDLLRKLAGLLPGVEVATSAALGVDPDWVEALAFAWLAKRTLHAEAGNIPTVTGARGPRVLGAVYAV